MDDLTLASVELVASPRPVAKNGATNSSDFNAFQSEVLADLAEIAEFLNEDLLPILQALPSEAADGLDGAALHADRSQDTPLFRDASGTPYTVSQVLTAISGAQSALSLQIAELGGRVLSLQSRLSSTSQNDLRASVQSLQDSYTNVYNKLGAMLGDVSAQAVVLSKIRKAAVQIPAGPAGTSQIEVVFNPAFADNDYVASVSLETTGGLMVQGFTKNPDGAGLTVSVSADGTEPTGTLHVIAQAF